MQKLRDRFAKEARDIGYQVQLIYVKTPIQTLEERRRDVGTDRNELSDAAFYPVVKGFEEPGQDENALVIDGTKNFEEQLTFLD